VATQEFWFLWLLVAEFSLISVEAVMDVPVLLQNSIMNCKLFLLRHSKDKHTTLEVQNLLAMMFTVGDIHF
jgi:hypothetical protein